MIVLRLTPVWCVLVLLGCTQIKVNYAANDGNENPLIFSTNQCYLTEPVYGHKFDFTALHSEFAHMARSDSGDIFQFNICGNMSSTCNGISNVAACLRKPDNTEYVLGTQHSLVYHNGKMYFSFLDGEKCSSNGRNYQLHVFPSCDYTLDPNQSKVTSYAPDACSFYITYETPLACLPEPDNVKSNNCSVRDPTTGHVYDLMKLSDSNYRTTDHQGNAFVINICKPVLYGENAMCPAESSVCFVKIKETNFKEKFINYGSAQQHLQLENDRPVIRHTSETRCNNTSNYTSIIYFYCDKDVKNAHPDLMGIHDGCTYVFSFVTPLACNELPPCTAIAHDSEVIDMSPLGQTAQFKLQQDNQNYVFSVCRKPGEPCMENDGACLVNMQSTSLGMANTHLRINQTGTPYLLYENGANCKKSDGSMAKWSTKIEFVCANRTSSSSSSSGNNSNNNNYSNTSDVGPKIIENSNCQLLIHYQTELACREQINCKTKVYVEHSEDGTSTDTVDLTPLKSAINNYEAEIDATLLAEHKVEMATKFFLNVCRPLVPKYGLGCPGGSAACMAKIDKDTGKPEEEQSLGFPLASLVASNRTSAEIRYLLGAPCPKDRNINLSSKIEFICEMRAGRGVPKLHKIADCHYQFTWATNVICPPHMCTFNEDSCEIMNDELNVRYNLKNASFAKGGKKKVIRNKEEFTLDLCDSHHKAVTDYSQGLVNLFFTTKGPCDSYGIINVQMRLICSNSMEDSTSFSECNLLYIQKTPDICDFLGLKIPPTAISTTERPSAGSSSTTSTTTTTQASKTEPPPYVYPIEDVKHPIGKTGSIGTILAAILSVTFLVACLGTFAFSPERRNSVRRLFRRTSAAVRYSRVNNSDEGNLLLNPNGEFSESEDEDMLL